MPLPTTGPLNFTNIQNEFGGTTPISLSEYYALASGLPTSGQISISQFYGKSFVVVETITSSRTWTPKVNLARFIHIYVVGAGGSGGHGWPARNVGLYGNTDGVAGGTGGGAGGVAYSVIPASAASSSTITIGVGGAGNSRTSEDGSVAGNNGTDTTFVGSSLNMRGGAGGGGSGASATSGGGDSTSVRGGFGGSASGGNLLNLSGGDGGSMSVSGSDVKRSGSGGGAPRFLSLHNGTGVNSTTEVASPGAKVSNYGNYPPILSSYITNRSQNPVLGPTILDFDSSNGTISSGGTGSPVFGAGSGGSGAESSNKTGRGGNGVVIIIYEI
jgi:hypothetical protein